MKRDPSTASPSLLAGTRRLCSAQLLAHLREALFRREEMSGLCFSSNQQIAQRTEGNGATEEEPLQFKIIVIEAG